MKKTLVSFLLLWLSSSVWSDQPTSSDISALWHLDGDFYETMETGSYSLGWYGEHFSESYYKVGVAATDCATDINTRARIQLEGDARLSGLTGFGIAFWVYRVNNRQDYGSILSFGTGCMEIEHVGPGNDERWFYVRNSGFCDFNGKWNHYVWLPRDTWTHVAITADGSTGRIILNGVPTWSASQTGLGFNAGNVLYLGGESTETGGLIDCYIDEIVFTNKPVGTAWGVDIYNATLNGRSLLTISDCEEVINMGLLIDGDINKDCYVNMLDLALMANHWLECNDPADENCTD